MAYTPLAEARIGDDDQISLYAVIIDAGSPYKNNAHNKFICTMKVVDQTLHSSTQGANKKVQHALCTFFSKRYEDLPVARKIGDIIRIHRALVKEYNNIK